MLTLQRQKKRKIKMKKLLICLIMMALTLTLALTLSGCSGGDADLEGKNIVTFEVNGGTLNYGTSSTKTKVNFAYYPGTYIVDPTTIPNYAIFKNGYKFTGWYTSAECNPSEKWDFGKTFDTETLTLYAGWEKLIKYTYTIYYADGESNVALGNYEVAAGATFDDYQEIANKRDNYTCIGYYKNRELTEPWDFDTTHPGGDVDLDIPVFVKHIPGEWELAGNYDELNSAINKGNVYLTADIDCAGKAFSGGTFNAVFEGNGYKISNFTVNKTGTLINPECAIFRSLGAKAEVRNVTFENVAYTFMDIKESTATVEVKANVAALAVSITEGAKVSHVSITGTMKTNYAGELPCLNEAYWYEGEINASIAANIDLTANITVDKQS